MDNHPYFCDGCMRYMHDLRQTVDRRQTPMGPSPRHAVLSTMADNRRKRMLGTAMQLCVSIRRFEAGDMQGPDWLLAAEWALDYWNKCNDPRNWVMEFDDGGTNWRALPEYAHRAEQCVRLMHARIIELVNTAE